ncbi:MAG TPA: hypothetical protein VL856_03700 [Acidimicrobiia bacterium]|nr:hypothetical protein [Acidimicrobiia bacterium]
MTPYLPIGTRRVSMPSGMLLVVSDLWIISRSRSTRLSYEETVRLGRALIDASGNQHISYPNEPMATAVVSDYLGVLSPKALDRIAEVLGEADMEQRA